MIVAATGHRPHKLGGHGRHARARLLTLAMDQLDRLRPDHVISGMALGWDEAVAMSAYLMGIPFTAAVPCRGQESRWPDEAQKRYRELLELADRVEVLAEHYSPRAMQKRNEWMVDRGDLMLALWDGMVGGGTANCIVYAERKRVPIENAWFDWIIG